MLHIYELQNRMIPLPPAMLSHIPWFTLFLF